MKFQASRRAQQCGAEPISLRCSIWFCRDSQLSTRATISASVQYLILDESRAFDGEMMAKVVPFILGLLVLAACSDNNSSPVRSSTVVPMNAEAWSILYSPGMPPHPMPQTGGGWYFDFPTDPNSVHYVLAAVNMTASSYVEAKISVATTGTPEFVYNLEPRQHLYLPGPRPVSVAGAG